MPLRIRKPAYTIPSYSLTGDVLSYMRCGLQYRLGNLGKLPASRPVQMWFGQFLHGVLEEAYRRYSESPHDDVKAAVPPTEYDDIFDVVKRRLASRGLTARSRDADDLAVLRATAALDLLGPDLFPLIERAEVRLTGTRMLPAGPGGQSSTATDRYEMAGVVDVITHLAFDNPDLADNSLLSWLAESIPDIAGPFEVIIDYKGMRRPRRATTGGGKDPDSMQPHEWQVQTYAHLREAQPDGLPVAAGLLLYLNELHPTWGDIAVLRREIDHELTDVTPPPGSALNAMIRPKRSGDPRFPNVPREFRLRRALHVVPITSAGREAAVGEFDHVVASIEQARAREAMGGSIVGTWGATRREDTCAACDFRPACPSYPEIGEPLAPGIAR